MGSLPLDLWMDTASYTIKDDFTRTSTIDISRVWDVVFVLKSQVSKKSQQLREPNRINQLDSRAAKERMDSLSTLFLLMNVWS